MWVQWQTITQSTYQKTKQLFGAGRYIENNLAQLRLQCGWQNGNAFEIRSIKAYKLSISLHYSCFDARRAEMHHTIQMQFKSFDNT